MVAVVCSALSVAVVLWLARAVRSPSSDDAAERLATLTDREREILKLFAEGLTYQEIGEIRNNSGLKPETEHRPARPVRGGVVWTGDVSFLT